MTPGDDDLSHQNIGGVPLSQLCAHEALRLRRKLAAKTIRGAVAARIRREMMQHVELWRYHRERGLEVGNIDEHGHATPPRSDWDNFPGGVTVEAAEESMRRILAGEV